MALFFRLLCYLAVFAVFSSLELNARAERQKELQVEIDLPVDSRFLALEPGFGDAKNQLIMYVRRISHEVEGTFGLRSPSQLTVKFLPEADFFARTGAPRWTTGVLMNPSLIVVPESIHSLGTKELRSTLRHEYLHATVAHLSNSRCPAWLDEGLAQIAEGASVSANDRQQLREVSGLHGCPPLNQLESGFTRMRRSFVPLAYGYSLFATEQLLATAESGALARYLQELSRGIPSREAFLRGFGMDFQDFEKIVNTALGCELRNYEELGTEVGPY